MVNCLLISGSSRKGNTDIVLANVFERIEGNKELIFLRDKKIKHCIGCLYCAKTDKCVLRDDMDELSEKMLWADVIIIGTLNYFDNVPGLLKDFIDRTNPFYDTDLLKDKKFLTVVVGGGKVINSMRVSNHALTYFSNAHHLDYEGSYCFCALGPGDVCNDKCVNDAVSNIVQMINKM